MALSITCPSCDKTLKVKDELAGRKVKCPGCGEPFVVAAEGEAGITAEEPQLPWKKARPVEDDEPPRKKKKKKKSNKGLLIGLGVGGAVLFLLLLVGVGVIIFLNTRPEKAKSTEQAKVEPKKEDGQNRPDPKVEEKRPIKNVVVRGMELQELKNMMKQLGLAYHSYVSTNNRGPAKWQDLSPYYEKVPQFDKALQDGWIVFIWNVRLQDMTQGTSNTILAYEKDAANAGLRVVLFGDGSVDMLDEEQFKAAPKAQPRK